MQVKARPDTLEQKGGELLFALQRIISANEKKEINCCGVTMTQALTLLTFHGTSSLLMRELACALSVKQSTMTRIVDPLVRDGYMLREADADDRRAVRVRLTPQGEETLLHLIRCYRGFWQRVFSRIPENRRKTVISSLEILTDVFNGLEADGCCSAE